MAQINATTQGHLEIEDIVDDIVLLSSGSACMVMQTTAVNFGLLSEKEQDATIFAYAALLNSLTFPAQIIIRSKRTDIQSYLDQLDEAYEKQKNIDLKEQIKKYREFVQATVQKGKVLDKKFFIVIPFSFLEIGARGAVRGIAAKRQKLPDKGETLDTARTILYPKRDHLIKQLARMGLAARVLRGPELIELYFDVYNPSEIGTQRIPADEAQYTTPLVQPSVEGEVAESSQPPKPQDLTKPKPIQETSPRDKEKMLRELQNVIAKAKTGLAAKTSLPPHMEKPPGQSAPTQSPPGQGREGK